MNIFQNKNYKINVNKTKTLQYFHYYIVTYNKLSSDQLSTALVQHAVSVLQHHPAGNGKRRGNGGKGTKLKK